MRTKEQGDKTESASGVLRRRTLFLQTMRKKTFEAGYFTTSDIAEEEQLPRSTAQDWINRLLKEGCIFIKEEQHGRNPARYAARSALPQTTCRRIFTTAADGCAEIFHECMSSGCAGFCEYHHRKAGGAAISVSRDGLIFRETARISDAEHPETPAELSLKNAAVGLVSVELNGDEVIQTIRSIYGGAAYSLSSMMGMAKGVCGVHISAENGFVTGTVRTKALLPVTVGIDDTDRKGCGGATFALANALFKYLIESGLATGIRHQVAALYPGIEEMTAGNSCSFLELAAPKENMDVLAAKICRFVEDESLSENWGVAIMTGIFVPEKLEAFAADVRSRRVSFEEAETAAKECGVSVFGKRGIIGATAAAALKNQPQEVLLDCTLPMIKDVRRERIRNMNL
ncbi:MAG TPA: sugar-specific transcriptional regulator TrmB [Methanocorpusculum sp.]|nr:sugar-specific transcriptional regulator TrmB [Methanocorpusculum sp.]